VNLIYDCMGPGVLDHVKEHEPNPRHRHNLHQFLTEEGQKKLRDHLQQVLGIAMTCQTIGEFHETLVRIFGSQNSLPLVIPEEFRLPSGSGDVPN